MYFFDYLLLVSLSLYIRMYCLIFVLQFLHFVHRLIPVLLFKASNSKPEIRLRLDGEDVKQIVFLVDREMCRMNTVEN